MHFLMLQHQIYAFSFSQEEAKHQGLQVDSNASVENKNTLWKITACSENPLHYL